VPTATARDGVQIAYEVYGPQDAEPVVMIHGLGADARGWALQRFPFGRRYRCIAIDNRGVGRSDKPPGPYDLEVMSEDVLAVMDAEGVESAHLIGTSMGGIIAQIIAVSHPERVRSLVLAATACRQHPWRRELFLEWRREVSNGGMNGLSEGALEWLIGPRLRKRFGVWLNLLARIMLQSTPEPFCAQLDAIDNVDPSWSERIREIQAPTLVIVGSQDALTPVGDSEELAELIPKAELVVIGGAAHGLMVESPNAFNTRVLEFLDGVCNDPTSESPRAG